MKRCPYCGHLEYEGALYCSECGAPLFSTSPVTQTLGAVYPPHPDMEEAVPVSTTSARPDKIVLLLAESGRTITLDLSEANEWTLGRLAPAQAVMPDIDLTPYNAYESGVSRLHAVIRVRDDGRVTITDLDSSNGTRVNGIKLPPNRPQQLHHGDMVSLGKLAFQVLFKTSNEDMPL